MPKRFLDKFNFIDDWRRQRCAAAPKLALARAHANTHVLSAAPPVPRAAEGGHAAGYGNTMWQSMVWQSADHAMVNLMDSKVGELVAALKAPAPDGGGSKYDNTIIFFSARRRRRRRPPSPR